MYQGDVEHTQHNVEQPPPTSAGGAQESIITVGQEEQVEQPQLERKKRKLAPKVDNISFSLLLRFHLKLH